MGTLKIGSGTTFNITIPLDKEITEYDNVLISLYTDERKPVRFSYVAKVGFNTLSEGNTSSELVGVLTSVQSAKMQGCLWMVMKAIDELTPDENIGNSIPTKVKDLTGRDIEIVKNSLSEIL